MFFTCKRWYKYFITPDTGFSHGIIDYRLVNDTWDQWCV